MSQKRSVALVIDLGATNVRVGAVREDGQLLWSLRVPTTRDGADGIRVTAQIIALIRRGLREKKLALSVVRGIGIASIGPLDYVRGGPVRSPNVPYDFISLVGPLTDAFAVPVRLYNDCNAAVIGEWRYGAGKGMQNIVYATISTGIGGGVIADERLIFGRGGNAAEVGHWCIDTSFGFPCACGAGVGHWEGLVSGANMPRFYTHWLKETRRAATASPYSDAASIFRAAREGNRDAVEFCELVAVMHARGISDLIAAYDPELISLGGAVALHNSGYFLDMVYPRVEQYLDLPKICVTTLGSEITLIGAGAGVFLDM